MTPESSNTPNAVPPPVGRTSGLAIASLVFGICSLACSIFTAIPALVCGGMAMAKINKPGSGLLGRGQAIAGLITGGLGMFLSLPIMAGLLVPAIAQARGRALEAACLNNARQIGAGIRLYATDNGNRLPAKFDDLKAHIQDLETVSRCPARPAGGVAYELTRDTDRLDDSPETVILKEVPGNHRQGRRATVFADGHVEMRSD